MATTIEMNDGTIQITEKGLFSSKMTSIQLDALRLIYLFLPETFQWRVIETRVRHHYLDLAKLSDTDYAEISAAAARQDGYNLGRTHLVLKDYAEKQATFSLKDLGENPADFLAALGASRAARREMLTGWLQTQPTVKFGVNMQINARGVGMLNSSKYWLPWEAMESYSIFSTQSATIFNFVPKKGCGIGRFGASGIPISQTQGWLAELEFWQAIGNQ